MIFVDLCKFVVFAIRVYRHAVHYIANGHSREQFYKYKLIANGFEEGTNFPVLIA